MPTTVAQSSSGSPVPWYSVESPYQESVLLQQLKTQIEYYFSHENLAHDDYLVSLLQKTEHLGAVPLKTICTFNKVKIIYSVFRGHRFPPNIRPPADPLVVIAALQGSNVVRVSEDGHWLSPVSPLKYTDVTKDTEAEATSFTTAFSAPSSPSSQTTGSSVGHPICPLPKDSKIERTTLIVRDIPQHITVDQVLQSFTFGDEEPISARRDLGQTWVVSFDSEIQAAAALVATRNRFICCGVPIRAHFEADQTPNIHAAPSRVAPVHQAHPQVGLINNNEIPLCHHMGYPGVACSHPPHPHGYQPYPHMQHQYFLHAYQPPLYPTGYTKFIAEHHRQKGYSAPVPHVYVGPPSDQRSSRHKTRKNKHKNKGGHSKRNGFANGNSSGTSVTSATSATTSSAASDGCLSRTKQPQRDAQCSATSQKKANTTQPKTDKQDKSKSKVSLDAHQFPALGNSNRKANYRTNEICGYAQALLKQPTAPPKNTSCAPYSQKSSFPQNENTLEDSIAGLAITETEGSRSYEW